jgi:hypothetical protein
MKKLIIIFLSLTIFLISMYAQAQVNIRKTTTAADPNQKNLQSIQTAQPDQPAQAAQYQITGTKTEFYSVDQTAFSSSWGVYEIRKLQNEGAYLYSTSTLGTAPYLVAPVNIPDGATITGMKVIFYDASTTQDLQAILWQGGPNFGGPDSYNLGQIKSNYSGGSILQAQALIAKVDNENHSYHVTVSPVDNKPWPENGELKIKRVTISYTEAE